MKTIYIGLAGEVASGKDLFSAIANVYFGAKVFRSSDLLGEILTILGCDHKSRTLLIKLPILLRKEFGENIISRAMIIRMKSLNKETRFVIWNGVRFPSDVRAIKKLSHSYIVGIETKFDLRLKRLRKRKEKTGENKIGKKELLAISEKETECGVRKIVARADFRITNNGTEIAFHNKIRKLLNQITKPS